MVTTIKYPLCVVRLHWCDCRPRRCVNAAAKARTLNPQRLDLRVTRPVLVDCIEHHIRQAVRAVDLFLMVGVCTEIVTFLWRDDGPNTLLPPNRTQIPTHFLWIQGGPKTEHPEHAGKLLAVEVIAVVSIDVTKNIVGLCQIIWSEEVTNVGVAVSRSVSSQKGRTRGIGSRTGGSSAHARESIPAPNSHSHLDQ